MKDFTVAVVEDDKRDAAKMKECLSRFSERAGVNFSVSYYTSGEAFLTACKRRFNIVFMDMCLNGMNGFDVSKAFRKLAPDSVLIFITNIEKYAIKGYEVDANDFILKPLNYNLFESKMMKVINRLALKEETFSIPVRLGNGETKLLLLNEIYFIEISSHDMVYHTADGDIEAYGSLKKIEEEISEHGFVRCSSWCLVNLQYIEGLYGDDIRLRNGETLHISRSKRKNFLNALNIYCAEGRIR